MIRIGLQVDLIGSYGRDVLRGLMQYANLAGNWEFVRPTMYSVERNRSLRPKDIHGAVIMVHSMASIRRLRRARVPIVNVAHTLDVQILQQEQLHSVLPDDDAIGRSAYLYFKERGFRSFAFCGHPTVGWSRHRQHAFTESARNDGCACEVQLEADAVSAAWISRLPQPVALFAANDRYAWLAIDACRATRRRVPEDVSILGVDNDLLLVDLVKPTLSSVQSGGYEAGITAGEVLSNLIARKRVPDIVRIIPAQAIVTRNSTEVLAVRDDDVVSALSFIRQSSSKPIGVADVVAEVMVSRRNLERKFREVLGRSILREIRRVRIERACALLRDTSFEMPAIASACGFASHVRFSTVFRQLAGESPTSYRRKHRGL
jgi:LacI family transcriptional regulator